MANRPADSIVRRTFTNPVVDVAVTADRDWRAAEIPAANGHGNARSVAAVQSVLANGGEARGGPLLSEAGGNPVVEEPADGDDPGPGLPGRVGVGHGRGR